MAERSPSSRRRIAAWITAATWLLAAALGWGLVREVRRLVVSVGYARAAVLAPLEWRMGSPAVTELGDLLAEIGSRLPPRRAVLFVPPPALGDQGQFAVLWAAYLLPAPDWVYAPDVGLDAPVELAVSWRTRLDDPRFEAVIESAHGGLYRRRQ